jgi:hypothetical protein
MSHDPSVVQPTRSRRQVEAAREASRKAAFEAARLSLRSAGEWDPPLDDVRAVAAEQQRVVSEINGRLAGESTAIARRDGGRGEDPDKMVRRILRERAAKAIGVGISTEEPEPGDGEEKRRTNLYRHFLNRA